MKKALTFCFLLRQREGTQKKIMFLVGEPLSCDYIPLQLGWAAEEYMGFRRLLGQKAALNL